MSNNIPQHKWLWSASLLFFIIAGCTGVMFRIGMTGLDFFGLSLQNIRHAHSHFMFFGWAGLLPLIILYEDIVAVSSNVRKSAKYSLVAILILSPVTYIFFLLWGYHPVSIGDAHIPMAAILSSFVMIAWYGFAVSYFRHKPTQAYEYSSWFQLAFVLLIVSSFGAWGVGILQIFEIENALIPKALTHFFLGTFTEGWVVLFVIGMIVRSLNMKNNDFLISPNTLQMMIAFGALLSFSYGIHYSMLTIELLWSVRVGGVLGAFALIIVVLSGLKKSGINKTWVWPLLLLGGKAVIQLIISLYPNEIWFSDHNLRILYLHLLLLGAFTIAGFGWIKIIFNLKEVYFRMMVLSCLLILASLILPTNFIPIDVKGGWVFFALIVTACLPVISALGFYLVMTLAQSPRLEKIE